MTRARIAAAVLLAACSSPKHAKQEDYANTARRPAAVVDAGVDAVVVDAAPDPDRYIPDAQIPMPPAASATAVDPRSLASWDLPGSTPATETATTTELFAVDVDGDRLLVELAKGPLLGIATGKHLTGRTSQASPQRAFEVVAAQLGIDPAPFKFGKGKGATVDIRFATAPTTDLVRLLADVGHVNIVVPNPQTMPKVDIVAKRIPWDAVLAGVAALSSRSVQRVGNTYYLLEGAAKLPALPKAPAKVVALDLHNATVAAAVAALGALVPTPDGACGPGILGDLHLKNVPLAEALRAVEVMSGQSLAPTSACPATPLELNPPLTYLALVGIAQTGTMRSAVFDRAGTVVVATTEGKQAYEIGQGYVTYGDHDTTQTSLSLYPSIATDAAFDDIQPWNAPDSVPQWARLATRVSVLRRTGPQWSAFVETPQRLEIVDPSVPPSTWRGVVVGSGGVTLSYYDERPLTIPLARP